MAGFYLIDDTNETIEACGACEAFGRGEKTYQPNGGLCLRHFNVASEKASEGLQ